jgi:hypothetical protein
MRRLFYKNPNTIKAGGIVFVLINMIFAFIALPLYTYFIFLDLHHLFLRNTNEKALGF